MATLPSRRQSPLPGTYQRVYRLVKKIPRGRVATYGQLASMIPRCSPRMVGYAMAATPDSQNIPWQRVVNSRGQISARARGNGVQQQKTRLREEGVLFVAGDRIDLRSYQWQGPSWRWLLDNGYQHPG